MPTTDDASGDLPVTGSLVAPAAALHWRFSRSSGPGGQGVNTADSRVELSFDVARSPSIPDALRERALQRLARRLVDGVLTVAEAAVVGAADETTGQGIVAFVILRGSAGYDESKSEAVFKELRDHVAKEIGPIAKPRQIMVVQELPKTRSGKIMRRLLKDVAENREVGDVTTLADSSVMNQISSGLGEGKSEE